MAFLQNLGRQPFGNKMAPVRFEIEPGREELSNRRFALLQECRVKEPLHRSDLEIMRQVVNVDRQRNIN